MNSNATTLHTTASHDSFHSLSNQDASRRGSRMEGPLSNQIVPPPGDDPPDAQQQKKPKMQFVEHFWGNEDAGLGVVVARLSQGKQTAKDIKEMFSGRANLEEEYGKKLMKLAKGGLGKDESGTLKDTLDTVRAELEQTGRSHIELAQQIRSELETSVAGFISRQRDVRKPQTISMEKTLRNKTTHTNLALKAKEKCESECTKASGLNAAKNTLTGKELEKCKLKVEKTETSARSADRDYAAAVDKLADVTKRWEAEWRAALEKYQELEEERIAFLKRSMWTYTNLVSAVCVTDDESCERIRVSLEKCDVDADMATFVNAKRTGGDIPQPIGYVNYLTERDEKALPYNGSFSKSQSLSNSAQSISSQPTRLLYAANESHAPPLFPSAEPGGPSFASGVCSAPMNGAPMMVDERGGTGYNFHGSESATDSRNSLTGGGGGGTATGSRDGLPTVSSDGRPIMFYVKCLYDFAATIPEELDVREGDVISCIATQEDGWWEGEVFGLRDGDPRKRLGLYPSNFTARL